MEEGRGLDPQWRTTRSLSKRCRSPDRLTFRVGGWRSTRSSCLAAPSVFKAAPASLAGSPSRLAYRIGVEPMSSTFGGSRSSAELPVDCLLVGAPGFDRGRLQQSAAPVYKTEPHASADAVLVGVAGFEPATSSFRTKNASRLRYTPEMARCTGLEPVSLDRQSSCLTRCITAQTNRGPGDRAQSPRPTKSGVPGSTRTSTERALNASPLPVGVQAHRGPGRI
jgi:hypothetical protein